MSEVGFEPGTFRSCVERSNHYATETPPIPDVLLVLVAPKYINRNVTTTLQSRFTPTPTPQATHSSFFILLLLLLLFIYLFIYFFFFFFFFFFVKLLNTSHSSPTITHIHSTPRTLRRPLPDLGVNVSDNIRCDVINSYLLTCLIWGIMKLAYILLT